MKQTNPCLSDQGLPRLPMYFSQNRIVHIEKKISPAKMTEFCPVKQYSQVPILLSFLPVEQVMVVFSLMVTTSRV